MRQMRAITRLPRFMTFLHTRRPGIGTTFRVHVRRPQHHRLHGNVTLSVSARKTPSEVVHADGVLRPDLRCKSGDSPGFCEEIWDFMTII
jgi:hypothetical protein